MASREADILVLGGGAAGLMASICAARHGARVLLLEKNIRLGRKILATGNGRCNLSNTSIGKPQSFKQYNKPDFVAPVLSRIDYPALCDVFDDFGLLTVADKSGWVFPRSRAATTVLDVILNELDRLKISVMAGQEVLDVQLIEHGFKLGTSANNLFAPALVLACGTAPLLNALAFLRLVETEAVLGPLKTDVEFLRGLDGIKAVSRILLMEGERIIAWQDGELLFREYGVSGIAIFNLSRYARPGHHLLIDFFPDLERQALDEYLLKRWERRSSLSATELFAGMLHGKIIQAILRKAGIRANELINQESLADLSYHMKAFQLDITGNTLTEQAQVTRGGLAVGDFNPLTLTAYNQPGLFAAGECLDIDAACGGYNLHWAFASGLVAGESAALYHTRQKQA